MADNLGYERMYDVHETRKGVWTFTGGCERATYTFDDGNAVMDVWWEYTKDGSAWDTLCKFRQTRAARN